MGFFAKLCACFKKAEEPQQAEPYAEFESEAPVESPQAAVHEEAEDDCQICQENKVITHMFNRMPPHSFSRLIVENAVRNSMRNSS